MKRIIPLVIAVMLVLSILVGCSSDTLGKTQSKEKVTEVITEAPTETSTEPLTEPPLTNEEILESNMWIAYSPQDTVFDMYEFSDGIVVEKSYSYSDGTIKQYMDDVYMTYEIQGEKITIINEHGYEQEWSFTDDPHIIFYSWQEYYGPESGPIVTQKIYHRESIPTYDEAIKEKENMWVK